MPDDEPPGGLPAKLRSLLAAQWIDRRVVFLRHPGTGRIERLTWENGRPVNEDGTSR